jgi:hypothetical protein
MYNLLFERDPSPVRLTCYHIFPFPLFSSLYFRMTCSPRFIINNDLHVYILQIAAMSHASVFLNLFTLTLYAVLWPLIQALSLLIDLISYVKRRAARRRRDRRTRPLEEGAAEGAAGAGAEEEDCIFHVRGCIRSDFLIFFLFPALLSVASLLSSLFLLKLF